MFKDRLGISSPGSFYQGEKIGKTYDLSIPSYLREKILQNLESQGYLLKITSSKPNLYKTNPDLVKG